MGQQERRTKARATRRMRRKYGRQADHELREAKATSDKRKHDERVQLITDANAWEASDYYEMSGLLAAYADRTQANPHFGVSKYVAKNHVKKAYIVTGYADYTHGKNENIPLDCIKISESGNVTTEDNRLSRAFGRRKKGLRQEKINVIFLGQRKLLYSIGGVSPHTEVFTREIVIFQGMSLSYGNRKNLGELGFRYEQTKPNKWEWLGHISEIKFYSLKNSLPHIFERYFSNHDYRNATERNVNRQRCY